MSENRSQFREIFGWLPQGLLGNFLIGALFLTLGIAFNGPQIFIERQSAIFASILLLALYLIITCWCLFTLTKNKMTQNLVTSGPYRFVRHPMYSAIIFLLNPALAIYFRSWLLMLAIIPIYFIWKKCAAKEERSLAQKFDQPYWQYERTTWRFLPNLWRINKILFYAVTAILIFFLAFVILNFSSVSLRWVTFPKNEKVIFDEPQQQPSPAYFQEMFAAGLNILPESGDLSEQISATGTIVSFGEKNRASYSASDNSISISKIGIHAPLIIPTGTSQKQLNQALDQGVIIYPGSALPGLAGEVFLSGHSSSYPWDKTQYGQIFTLLDKLEAGDTVSLAFNHTQYDYRVINKQVLAPADTKIVATDKPILSLMTCWPIGTALKRLVVRAELIQ